MLNDLPVNLWRGVAAASRHRGFDALPGRHVRLFHVVASVGWCARQLRSNGCQALIALLLPVCNCRLGGETAAGVDTSREYAFEAATSTIRFGPGVTQEVRVTLFASQEGAAASFVHPH